ncbi:mcfS [Symbiodinium necroappetens]|uniref:McfS protein n=1 Tax=Symbiodinium necroappetens TaxID=1628268 RepID=A0A812LZ57_9DINO|nr:mcfS [Symbiodinium necroappetens]
MDTLKSRWQVACRKTTGQTCFGFARTLLLQEGLWMGLWRPGLAANVASMGCCVGMRNGLYTVFRDGIGHLEDRASGIPPSATGKAGPVAMFTAGLFSGMAGYIITAPLLQVKTRMQAEAGRIGPDGRYVTGLRRGHAPTYRSTFQALHALASARCPHERMRSLWRGAGVIVARGAALSGSQLISYDAFKTMMKAYNLMKDGTADVMPMRSGSIHHASELDLLPCRAMALFFGRSGWYGEDENEQEEEEDEERHPDPEQVQRPRPQCILRNGKWMEVWPEHWGMRMHQIRELLNSCKEDVHWHQSHSVRDMVNQHLLPRTAGEGVGYAVKINRQSPLEVDVLISHSWNENAEEFVDTLERTVDPEEVLFVCAFSIYQNEDNAGPSIAEQIGSSTRHSPFGRVLSHIQARGASAGFWWWPRRTFYMLPGLCLLLALELFMVSQLLCGGVAGIEKLYILEVASDKYCSNWREGKGTCLASHWVVADLDGYCAATFPLVWSLVLFGIILEVALRGVSRWVYSGRMVAVPNYQDNLYQRLWCVYEIFMATQLRVYVSLAHTLAPAGKVHARNAGCSNVDDEARIRREIESFGARVRARSKSKLFERHGTDSEEAAAEEGYRRVDASITWTTTRAKREWLLVILRIILLGTALQGSVTVLSLSLGLKKRYFALGYIFAFFLYMALMWSILRRTGCIERRHLLLLGMLPFLTGVMLVVMADLVAPDFENHSMDVVAAMGFVFVMFGVSSLFLPLTRIRKFRQNWRPAFLCMVGALTWLGFYVSYAIYFRRPAWSFQTLDLNFAYPSLMQTATLNCGPPLLACYIWSFLLAWGVRMQIVHKDPSVTEHMMQGVVDLRANSVQALEEGLQTFQAIQCGGCCGSVDTETSDSSVSEWDEDSDVTNSTSAW